MNDKTLIIEHEFKNTLIIDFFKWLDTRGRETSSRTKILYARYLKEAGNTLFGSEENLTPNNLKDLTAIEIKERWLNPLSNKRIANIEKLKKDAIINGYNFNPKNITEGLSSSSINLRLNTLSSYLNFLCDKNLLESNPLKHTSRYSSSKDVEHQQTILTNEEYNSFLEKLEKRYILSKNTRYEYTHLRDYLIFNLMLRMGLRVGEVESLNIDSYSTPTNRATGITTPYLDFIRKGGKKASLPIPEDIFELLKEYIILRLKTKTDDAHDKALFVGTTTKKQRLSTSTIRRNLKSILKSFDMTNLIDLSPHDLRHTFATNSIEDGLEVSAVSKFLGHSCITTTLNIYVHSKDEQLRAVANNSRKTRDTYPTTNIVEDNKVVDINNFIKKNA